MADSGDVAVAVTNLLAALLQYDWPSSAGTAHAITGVAGPSLVSVPSGTRRTLGQFSTRNVAFYDHVAEIRALIWDFVARPSPRKPLNLLVSAPPGSGKSFLVKQLLAGQSGEARIPCLELNVANLAKRSDIGAAWSFMRTMQSNQIKPCVFFDEIDAHVEGDYLLQDVLMPMNDAAVIYNGATLALGPAVFIFAGSKLFEPLNASQPSGPTEEQSVPFGAWRKQKESAIRMMGASGSFAADPTAGSSSSVPKIRDFLDRIDKCVIFPDPAVAFVEMDKDAKEWEKIDLVLSMIHRHFPHVAGVEPTAAMALGKALINGASKRAVERLVFTAIVPSKTTIFAFGSLPQDAQALLTAEELRPIEHRYQGVSFSVE
jgi:hypothetical protein